MSRVIQIIRRTNGIVEFVCEHGVGHPSIGLSKLGSNVGSHIYTHGCDGCCSHKDFRPTDEQIKEFERQ